MSLKLVLSLFLAFQNTSEEMCGSQFFAPDIHCKRKVQIETRSALPSHYTVSVKGNRHLRPSMHLNFLSSINIRSFYSLLSYGF